VEELVRQADVIAVGRVVSMSDGGFNLARNPRDHSQPASDMICPATAYEVKVEHYLKGDAGVTLRIVQAEEILLPDGIEEGGTVHVLNRGIPLEVGTRYLLFLVQGESYPDSPFPDLHFGVAEPNRFRLEDGEAQVESPWVSAEWVFPRISEKVLLQQVVAEVK